MLSSGVLPPKRTTVLDPWRRATRRACTCGSPNGSAALIHDSGCGDEALGYYASIVHAVGVRLDDDDGLDIAAPFGLHDMFDMVIRPNRALDNAASHAAKAERVRAIWPEVVVEPWNTA